MKPFAFDLAVECAHIVMTKTVTSRYTVTVIVFVFFCHLPLCESGKKGARWTVMGEKTGWENTSSGSPYQLKICRDRSRNNSQNAGHQMVIA